MWSEEISYLVGDLMIFRLGINFMVFGEVFMIFILFKDVLVNCEVYVYMLMFFRRNLKTY